MRQHIHILLYIVFFFSFFVNEMNADTGRYRVMWRDNPATTMVIAWDQLSGNSGEVYLDTNNYGEDPSAYQYRFKADYLIAFKKMNNHFVRLKNLKPNTVYYFLIKDDNSVSRVMSFKTAPNNPNERLSIIAGGDSRNHRDARRNANKIVSKLRPHAVMFGGDMTGGDTGEEWKDWFDDWQLTISEDGRMYPIIVARGNHEASNKSLSELFDVAVGSMYYSLSLGGDLLKIFTLNSMIAPGGSQREWLDTELAASNKYRWKFAQYHISTLPHTARKAEKKDQLINWSTLFYKYGLDLVCESDAHVVKSTYPIRPSKEEGSAQGFIRDDERGTVYVGEGCWGAPLRRNDDDKPWTRASGSFNQFKWIFVDMDRVEIRTIMTDGADNVASVNPDNIFREPIGLVLWTPPTGDVIEIHHRSSGAIAAEPIPTPNQELALKGEVAKIENFVAKRKGADVTVNWTTYNEVKGMTFKVQRSLNGKNYLTISEVFGKGKEMNNYLYTDKGFAARHPGQYVNYRIVRVFPNGKTTVYSPRKK